MRLLFTFAGGEGHLQPMLPLARRAAAAGHTVTVTGAKSLGSTVRRAGLGFVWTGPDVRPQRRSLQAVDLDNEYRVVGEYFAGRLGPWRAGRSWRSTSGSGGGSSTVGLRTGPRPRGIGYR